MMLFLSAIGMAQHSFNISYNESIDLGKIEDKTQFFITNANKSIKVKGDKINSYKFEKPGVYNIKVIHKEEIKKEACEHNHLPDEIVVNVSRIKMTFDGSRMTLSEPILKQKGLPYQFPYKLKHSTSNLYNLIKLQLILLE